MTPANAEKPAEPRRLAVAPVNRIVPRRRDVALDAGDEVDDFFFLACIGSETVRFTAFGPYPLHQRHDLFLGTAGDAGDEAFTRKSAGNRAAGGVAGSDHQGYAFFGHKCEYRVLAFGL